MISKTKNRLNALINNKLFVKFFKNTSWLLLDKVLRIFIGLIMGVWIARYLGPEQFGLLSYAQSFVGLFLVIALLGLDAIVVKELVSHPKKRDTLLGTAFFLRIIGALIVFVLVYIANSFFNNSEKTSLLIFIIVSATFIQSFQVIEFYFEAEVKAKYIAYSNIITLFISSIIKIIFILTQKPLIYFAFITMIDALILSFSLLYYYSYNHLSVKRWSIDFTLAKKLLTDSWPLILSGIVISIYMKTDQIMINQMLSSEANGYYAVAAKLSTSWYFIPIVISNSLFPAIISAKEESKELYLTRLQQLYTFLAWLAISVAIFISFFSQDIIKLLYGEAFIAASDVLIIHIWAGVFVFLGIASSKWFILENLQKYSFYRTLAGAIINLILNYILIPYYGIIGAAIATLISQFVASYFFNLFNKKLINTFILQTKAIFWPLYKWLKIK